MEQFPALISCAFVLGLAVRFVGLPPLVGFLLAGFVLNRAGFVNTPVLETVGDLGVTLLLFSIGLKLQVSSLLRPEVWGSATLHMALTVSILGTLLFALPFGILGELDLPTAALVAFALSFSSTVFAVKVFEDHGQSGALHARTAVGMLIIQDIIAVVFLAISKGRLPSPWAIGLLLLIPGRRLLKWLMERAGHGELLLLLAVMMTFAGSSLFELLDLKGDLGALVFGMLVADHPKADEMAKALLSFKDLFLVGFFLSIGLRGAPSVPDLAVALFLIGLIPVKLALYFGVLTRFRFRARTATMTSLALANYSEFGLIVAALGVTNGWLSEQWLLIIAVSVGGTFIGASPVNAAAHRIYDRFRSFLMRFQTPARIPEERPMIVGDALAVIFGMGRVGTGSYETMRAELGDRLLGVDVDPVVVEQHVDDGRKVCRGDPTDLDFCERVAHEGHWRLAMLALPNHWANMAAAAELLPLKDRYGILVSAIAKHDDEVRELLEHGVDAAFNLYANVGPGYADFVREELRQTLGDPAAEGHEHSHRAPARSATSKTQPGDSRTTDPAHPGRSDS